MKKSEIEAETASPLNSLHHIYIFFLFFNFLIFFILRVSLWTVHTCYVDWEAVTCYLQLKSFSTQAGAVKISVNQEILFV